MNLDPVPYIIHKNIWPKYAKTINLEKGIEENLCDLELGRVLS